MEKTNYDVTLCQRFYVSKPPTESGWRSGRRMSERIERRHAGFARWNRPRPWTMHKNEGDTKTYIARTLVRRRRTRLLCARVFAAINYATLRRPRREREREVFVGLEKNTEKYIQKDTKRRDINNALTQSRRRNALRNANVLNGRPTREFN